MAAVAFIFEKMSNRPLVIITRRKRSALTRMFLPIKGWQPTFDNTTPFGTQEVILPLFPNGVDYITTIGFNSDQNMFLRQTRCASRNERKYFFEMPQGSEPLVFDALAHFGIGLRKKDILSALHRHPEAFLGKMTERGDLYDTLLAPRNQ